MFGALLGTLQKFRQEETQLKDKVSNADSFITIVTFQKRVINLWCEGMMTISI